MDGNTLADQGAAIKDQVQLDLFLQVRQQKLVKKLCKVSILWSMIAKG